MYVFFTLVRISSNQISRTYELRDIKCEWWKEMYRFTGKRYYILFPTWNYGSKYYGKIKMKKNNITKACSSFMLILGLYSACEKRYAIHVHRIFSSVKRCDSTYAHFPMQNRIVSRKIRLFCFCSWNSTFLGGGVRGDGWVSCNTSFCTIFFFCKACWKVILCHD